MIDIPLSGTSSVDNSFVVFVQKNEESDTIAETIVPEVVKDGSNFTMNLNAMVNSDAAVNIFLPQNMGSINARGNGNINLGYKGDDLELRGDYIITSGAFNFVLEVVKRTFTLRRGGSIRWTGDPTDADIDIVGVYRTKSSLTS
ncbi:MAG: translocation/assembly module TamB domain-containing protein, partial [Thermoguttaceae bacterium]|nr:translocation/assembly module TamB domain-containing protein [Thermoguttaceae bacterium]